MCATNLASSWRVDVLSQWENSWYIYHINWRSLDRWFTPIRSNNQQPSNFLSRESARKNAKREAPEMGSVWANRAQCWLKLGDHEKVLGGWRRLELELPGWVLDDWWHLRHRLMHASCCILYSWVFGRADGIREPSPDDLIIHYGLV